MYIENLIEDIEVLRAAGEHKYADSLEILSNYINDSSVPIEYKVRLKSALNSKYPQFPKII